MKLRPYPEYKDSGVPWLGKIPAHWELRRAKYILRERDERWQEDKGNLLSVSQYTGVTQRRKKEGSDAPDTRAESLVGYKCANTNDLVVNIMLAWNGSLGVSPAQGVVSPAYCVYKFQDGTPWYYHNLLRCAQYRAEIKRRSRGVVDSRLRLYTDDLFRLPLIKPSDEEQTQIARFLDWKTAQINKFIRNKRRIIELLKEQKQNVINQAVTRGLDPNVKLKPSGVEWIGDIPGHWEMRKITHLYRQIGSGTTPQSGNADYYDGNIPWIISGDLTDGFLETTSKKVTDKAVQDYSTLKMYPEGSLVVAMYGATIGKVSLTSIRACTNQACCVLSNPRNDINNKFMLQLFLKIKPDLVRMGYGGGQPNISQDTIKGLRLPIPSIEEQGDIVTFIENETATIDYAITHAKREIELMREYRTRLISDVVTGQVDVRGIEVPDVAEDELLALVEDTGEADEVIDDEGEMDETD
jgi:type I restriction enzyme S subunit